MLTVWTKWYLAWPVLLVIAMNDLGCWEISGSSAPLWPLPMLTATVYCRLPGVCCSRWLRSYIGLLLLLHYSAATPQQLPGSSREPAPQKSKQGRGGGCAGALQETHIQVHLGSDAQAHAYSTFCLKPGFKDDRCIRLGARPANCSPRQRKTVAAAYENATHLLHAHSTCCAK
eukprot:GHUV01026750.1.p1 GENE.GHUV01026750.1~~GHUV01026750.1.p1  ORF type:complete len:173 (-),score=33.33 GHUV01026750.1:177-695(-)